MRRGESVKVGPLFHSNASRQTMEASGITHRVLEDAMVGRIFDGLAAFVAPLSRFDLFLGVKLSYVIRHKDDQWVVRR